MESGSVQDDGLIKQPFTDRTAFLLIVLLGTVQFFLCRHANDYVSGDVTYYELAHSLLQRRWYGFNNRPETMLPPGFAVILAGIWMIFGNSYDVFVHTMPVFAILFLCSAYVLLRHEVGRGPAAAICLLIGSSPIFFRFSTTQILSDLPYAFTSTLALVVAQRLDAAADRRARVGLAFALGVLLIGSLMLRSATIALLAALAAWLVLSVAARGRQSRARLRSFLPVLAVAILIQTLWAGWAREHEHLQWPSVGGFPGGYLSQATLKSGNRPELGAASLTDHALTVRKNLAERSAAVMEILTRRWFDPAWNSPAILGTVVLVLLGLQSSRWLDGSGIAAFYFIFYELMYIVWPWELEIRFLLPVTPLACLYLWRGGQSLFQRVRQSPRIWTVWALCLGAVMALYSASLWIHHRQGKSPFLLWASLAASAAIASWPKAWSFFHELARSRPGTIQTVATSVVGGLVAYGMFVQGGMAFENLAFDLEKEPLVADIRGARWLQAHTSPDAVVMARQEDLCQHCSGRKIVWFPPSSDPAILMDGIREHHVEWILDVDRENSYFLPPETECFARLSRAYPDAFRLVHEGFNYRVFRVIPNDPKRPFPSRPHARG